MTPHIEAQPGDYAEAVLLPGDPMRAQWIAATFFANPRQVNAIRGSLGFTGSYRGMPVSVQATGMGRPSFEIYLHELATVYGLRRAIRVGTCGGLDESVALRDVVIATEARTDVEIAAGDPVARPDAALLQSATALSASIATVRAGILVSSDRFYDPVGIDRFAQARQAGAIACDMETGALYALAPALEVRALSICTVVDHLLGNLETEHSERPELFRTMCKLALDVLIEDAPQPKKYAS